MGPGFWRMLCTVQVLWRLVREEPQAELPYRCMFGGGADQVATQTQTMTDHDSIVRTQPRPLVDVRGQGSLPVIPNHIVKV
jgi:hypothetical protein